MLRRVGLYGGNGLADLNGNVAGYRHGETMLAV